MSPKIYGSDWETRGTKVKPLGLIFAPEIFRLEERIYRPNGRVIMEGSKYFTWPVAYEIVSSGKTPPGWRMITAEESRAIQARYNNTLYGLIALSFNGFIAPGSMAAYNYYPAGGDYLVTRRGEAGYYWINNPADSLYPNALENSGLKLKTVSLDSSFGLPLLLVKNI